MTTLKSNPNQAPERTEPVPFSPDVDVLIIGSGFAGLCMAIKAAVGRGIVLRRD